MSERIHLPVRMSEEDRDKIVNKAEKMGLPADQLLGHIAPEEVAGVNYLNKIAMIGAAVVIFVIGTGWFATFTKLNAESDKVAQLEKGNASATPDVDTRHDMELLAMIAERSHINQQNLGGRTILHEAVRNRSDLATFDFLIGQGADLNKRAYGFEMNGGGKRDAAVLGLTPVMAAMFAGKKDPRRDEIALYLITHHGDKIDFTLETRHGHTLLAMALRRLQDQPNNRVLLSIVEICKLKSNTKG